MWFRKDKNVKEATPQKCTRCRERVGTLHLTRVATQDAPAGSICLCAECARELRNDPGHS